MADISSKSVVWKYLHILRDWGWITWVDHTIRTIRLTRPTKTMVIRKKAQRKAKDRHVA